MKKESCRDDNKHWSNDCLKYLSYHAESDRINRTS